MDSIEDMFLKLLVRGMNPSGHFGASKGLLFYSRIIFRQKNRKPQHRAGFKTQGCHVSCQEGQPGPSPTAPAAEPGLPLLPAELHTEVRELPASSWPANLASPDSHGHPRTGRRGEMLSHIPSEAFCPAQFSSLPAAQD